MKWNESWNMLCVAGLGFYRCMVPLVGWLFIPGHHEEAPTLKSICRSWSFVRPPTKFVLGHDSMYFIRHTGLVDFFHLFFYVHVLYFTTLQIIKPNTFLGSGRLILLGGWKNEQGDKCFSDPEGGFNFRHSLLAIILNKCHEKAVFMKN